MTTDKELMMTASAAPRRAAIRHMIRWLACALIGLAGYGALAAPALANSPGPGWLLSSEAVPTVFSPGDSTGTARYEVTARNVGSTATDGTPFTITDTAPAGLTIVGVDFYFSGFPDQDFGGPFCTHTDSQAQCNFPPFAVAPDSAVRMDVHVTVDPSASGTVTNLASINGAGAPSAATEEPTVIGTSSPPFGIHDVSMHVSALDGSQDNQAADHPYETVTSFSMNEDEDQAITPDQQNQRAVKDTIVDLPAGLIGNPQATPRCTPAELESTANNDAGDCPAQSQIGTIALDGLDEASLFTPQDKVGPESPIYNLVPDSGHAAEFGFKVTSTAVVMYADLVPSGGTYIVRLTIPGAPDLEQLTSATTTFFGDPGARDGDSGTTSAFLTNGADCAASGQTITVMADRWQSPGRFTADGSPDLSDSNWKVASTTLPQLAGCNALSFTPQISARPDTTVADSPSGVDVDISVPQAPATVGVLATPPLRKAVVTLPAGFTVNPGSAEGLGACSPAQVNLGSNLSAACPDSSKIGTVELTSPLVDHVLDGSIYLASENDNPSGSLLAAYIVIDDPQTGINIKLPGKLTADASTGQITGVFDNNPQFPFSDLKLQFKGGPRGVLATPESCGTFTTNAAFTPWSAPDSGPDAAPSDPFSITSGCQSGFYPSFIAGTQNAQAGAHSPFVLSFSRSDTDQELSGLSVKLPPGLVAKLAGVQECSDAQLAAAAASSAAAQAASPSCPAGSQVGTVTTGAGVGPDPFFLGGKAYLTGPYKGAPYGLAVVVPALAGPFDLGTVVVRQALYIDPTTAQVTAVSDPLPTILDVKGADGVTNGFPLRIRRVDVNLNRPDFTLNPTNCDPMTVTATLSSTGGLTSTNSPRFQVGGCSSLGFSPKLQMKLTGKGQTHSGTHPTLTASVTQPLGQANIGSARVALPLSLALDPKNSNNVCNYDTAQAVHGGNVGCPASTIVGKATVVTALLDNPLTGNVYLVQGIRFGPGGQRIHTLPSLLIPLRGQIALDLRAQSSVSGGKLVTTFPTIPDAPVSKFTLQINGGPKGILAITGRGHTICRTPQTANAQLEAQSGKTEALNPRLSTLSCRDSHAKKHKKHSKHKA
jgi:hypothetical protein